MRRAAAVAARAVSAVGLAGVSALHLVWASGSPWPARDDKRLAEAVIGSHGAMPGVAPTLVVSLGTAGAALVASGAVGRGSAQRLALRSAGAVLLARAVLGGGVALSAMGLPPAGATFRRLDRRIYRPLTAVLGVALWLASFEVRPSLR